MICIFLYFAIFIVAGLFVSCLINYIESNVDNDNWKVRNSEFSNKVSMQNPFFHAAFIKYKGIKPGSGMTHLSKINSFDYLQQLTASIKCMSGLNVKLIYRMCASVMLFPLAALILVSTKLYVQMTAVWAGG